MLLRRKTCTLSAQSAQCANDHRPGFARQNNAVDVAALGGVVRVGVLLGVLGHELGAAGHRVGGLLQLAAALGAPYAVELRAALVVLGTLRGRAGGPVLRLLELELIEPCLYLREGGPAAAAALADALEARLAAALTAEESRALR